MSKIVDLERTCIACPTIFEGKTDDGKDFYARYRGGILKVKLDDDIIYEGTVGDQLDGDMSFSEIKDIVNNRIDDLKMEFEPDEEGFGNFDREECILLWNWVWSEKLDCKECNWNVSFDDLEESEINSKVIAPPECPKCSSEYQIIERNVEESLDEWN